jgi:hypothetical protein
MQVVIDKSYLQGAWAGNLRGLCVKHTVLFTETLLYELLTTSEEAIQRACFDKFPEMDGDIVLIPRTGPLFRYEIEHERAATPLTDHRVQATFAGLVSGVFGRSEDQQRALEG